VSRHKVHYHCGATSECGKKSYLLYTFYAHKVTCKPCKEGVRGLEARSRRREREDIHRLEREMDLKMGIEEPTVPHDWMYCLAA